MRNLRSSATILAIVTAFTLLATQAHAQPADNQPGRGGRGGGIAGMIDRLSGNLKEQLGASDDEWKILEPRIQKVVALQAQTGNGPIGGMLGMFGMMGRGGRGGRGGDANPNGGAPATMPSIKIGDIDITQSDSAKALADLRTLMQNKDAAPGDVRTKLETLRKARAAVKTDLVKAQKDLREVLNLNQEAQLVIMGLLD